MKKLTPEEIDAMIETLQAMREGGKKKQDNRPETLHQREARESMEAKAKAIAAAAIRRPELEKEIAAFRASKETSGRKIIGLNGVPYPNKTALVTYDLFCKFTDSAGKDACLRDAALEIAKAIEDGVDAITASSQYHAWIMFYGYNKSFGEIRKSKAQREAEREKRIQERKAARDKS